MSTLDQVADLLSLTDEGLARSQRRFRRRRTTGYVYFSLLALGCTVAGAAFLWQTWRSGGSWLHFWALFAPLLTLCSSSLKLVFRRGDPRAALFAPVRALRAAILARDQRLAPLAVEQPVPWDTTLQPRGDVVGSFRRIRSRTALWALGGAFIQAFIGLPLGSSFLVAADADALRTVGWIVLAMSAALLVAPVAFGLWLRRRLQVHVDDQGLWWRTASGRKVRIDWHRPRAFYRTLAREGDGHIPHLMYCLDAGDVALAWCAKGVREVAASERLASLIAERTRQPPRDVSIEAQHIARVAETEARAGRRRRRAQDVAAGGAGVVGGAASGASELRTPRWAWVVPLVLLGSFIMTALGVQVMQPHYFGALYTQAHAYAPLYTDTLSTADSDWPSLPPEATFDAAGYEIRPGVRPLVPHLRDNVLIEVTGRTGGDFDLGGVGFIVSNPRDPADTLAFRVTPSGEYWLDRYGKQFPDGDKFIIEHDDAIHKGFDTPNRFAVLVRGSQYTFYVSGQFAATYTDDTLRGGRVALYVDDTSDRGAFRDFAMYPAA